jgi:RimJ/RimL family protein N-acetyltransferase
MTRKIDLQQGSADHYRFALDLYLSAMRPLTEQLMAWDEQKQRDSFVAQWKPDEVSIIVVDGIDVGWLQIIESSADIRLLQFFLAPEFRRAGIGTEVLRRLVTKWRASGKPIALTVLKNNPARNLYERFSFAVTGEAGVKFEMRRTVQLPPIPTLETERLILRPLAARDVPAIQRLFPQWDIVRWLSAYIPWPFPADGAATNMADTLDKLARGEKYFWAITLKGSDELRGRIDLWPFDGETRDMRGFWLDPELQGRGLMTEAANAVTVYALEELKWPFLYLNNALANRASARVKEKQGAVEIAREPFGYVSGEGVRQTWLLTREAWLARKAADLETLAESRLSNNEEV